MKDLYGREIDYMRISITDRCNLRCRYCMPEGITWIPMKEILTYEEILRVCEAAVSIGICKFRITGGEPLVRRDCVYLVERLTRMPGVRQVSMTTNGILLKEHLEELTAAGLSGVNISLDTMDPDRYREITGSSKLDAVLDSIEAAVRAGLKVKINSVLEKGVNDWDWPALIALAKKKDIDVRFIEMMPIGEGLGRESLSNESLLAEIQDVYPDMQRDHTVHGNGPALYYKIPGFAGDIGFISAIHGKFCSRCNRLRLTATGDIKPCLCYGESCSVREAARFGRTDEIKRLLCQAVQMKPEQHCFEKKEQITEHKKMGQIGG